MKTQGVDIIIVDFHAEATAEKKALAYYLKERVNISRKIQLERYKKENIYSNSELTPKLIKKYCVIDDESEKILSIAFEKLKLSARAYTKIIKVARTIADICQSKNIKKEHIIEAIQYRSLDKND